MICNSFNDSPWITIITNANDETDIITFYNRRPSLVQYIPKDNVLIISGDMNIHKGKEKNYKYCLQNLLKKNGEYLADCSLKNIKLKKKKWIIDLH